MKDLTQGADISVNSNFAEVIREQSKTVIKELFDNTQLSHGNIIVIGCSSSEVIGNNIGKGSSYEVAKIIFEAIYPEIKAKGLYLAAQC